MCIRDSLKLDRRQLLRGMVGGLSAAVALPTLEAALDDELGLFTRRAVTDAVEALRAAIGEDAP